MVALLEPASGPEWPVMLTLMPTLEWELGSAANMEEDTTGTTTKDKHHHLPFQHLLLVVSLCTCLTSDSE